METKEIGEQGGKCSQRNCFRTATSGMVVCKTEVWFCETHISDAMEALA